MADAIAIVGGGTAGLATACLLARSRYRVTVFERFENPMPVGAGILVQPTGMAVLASMGLLDAVAARASRIERMDGRTLSGRRIMDIRYADAGTGCHGLGVHRGNLFQVLHDAAFHAGVEFRLGTEVTGVTPKGYVTVAGGDW
jgi:2-polyprenyl-6-methoxyphenol hydroxylase-like FAD-dependent oxidoreductase